MYHSSKRTPHTSTQQSKVVQEVQAQEDQNTGKTKNVNIIEMIRSMGLCECQAKNPPNANVQEMSIIHDLSRDKNPVFYTSVQAQVVTTTWENFQNIMEPEVSVATAVEQKDCAV